jgi:hypothetical protein
LLVVAKSGVEDADVLGVRDAIGDVTWAGLVVAFIVAGDDDGSCWWEQETAVFFGASLGERREGVGEASGGG